MVELSKNTARKVKQLLASPLGPDGVITDARGRGRIDMHVLITGDKSGDFYPCKACVYNPQTQTWTTYDKEHRCLSSNDDVALAVDKRYRAVCYGKTTTDYYLFVADANPPEVDCGLMYNTETGKLEVYPDDFAGCGLYVTEDADSDSGTTCLKLNVDVDALVGLGLKVDDEACDSDSGDDTCCPPIKIDDTLSDGPTFTAVTQGGACGLQLTTYQIKVNPAGVFMGIEELSSTPLTSLEVLVDVEVECVDGEISVTKTYETVCVI